jgi:hypothetical protein
MTQKEAVKELKDFLRISNVEPEQLNFDSKEEAVYNGRTIFKLMYEYPNFDIYTPDDENVCTIDKEFLIEIFPQLEPLIICQTCNGSGIDYHIHAYDYTKEVFEAKCECESVIYK